MRIVRVEVANIAGLCDFSLEFGTLNSVAFAGPNGTGKSRLLSCLLAPWLNNIPPSGDDSREAYVELGVLFTPADLDDLHQLDAEIGGGAAKLDATCVVRVTRKPLAGVQVTWIPSSNALRSAFANAGILEKNPQLDVLYLPADRRFRPAKSAAVDVAVAAQPGSKSTAQTKSLALQNAGALDDTEFNSFASALRYAAALETAGKGGSAADRWTQFQHSIDQLLAPKRLIGPTSSQPDKVLVELPSGVSHDTEALSSGERQALTLISRVSRAGQHRTITIVDEPDAYLHPRLTAQLMKALRPSEAHQLFLATHSPSILDSVSIESIYELRSGAEPRPVLTEKDRVRVYREAGFKASELTQAELFIITEGQTDEDLLLAVDPSLSRAAFRPHGGRAQVIGAVSQLAKFDLPVLGVVDGDVLTPDIPAELADHLFVWPTADLEAAILSDRQAIEAMLRAKLTRTGVTAEQIQLLIGEEMERRRENVVAEIVGRTFRLCLPNSFPSPKGNDPIDRLKATLTTIQPISDDEFDETARRAEQLVEHCPDPWKFHRGKPIAEVLANKLTEFSSGLGLLRATVAAMTAPPLATRAIIKRARSMLAVIDKEEG